MVSDFILRAKIVIFMLFSTLLLFFFKVKSLFKNLKCHFMNANMDVTNHTSKFFHSNKLTPSLFFQLSFFTFYIHHSRFHAITTQ